MMDIGFTVEVESQHEGLVATKFEWVRAKNSHGKFQRIAGSNTHYDIDTTEIYTEGEDGSIQENYMRVEIPVLRNPSDFDKYFTNRPKCYVQHIIEGAGIERDVSTYGQPFVTDYKLNLDSIRRPMSQSAFSCDSILSAIYDQGSDAMNQSVIGLFSILALVTALFY